jgi:hypothetical protein
VGFEELGVRAVMVALNGRLFEGPLHPLDLVVDPRRIGLGQPVLDVVGIAKHVEHMDPPARCGSKAVFCRTVNSIPLSVSTVTNMTVRPWGNVTNG